MLIGTVVNAAGILAGMVAQVEIKVGRRRVIEYVIHPLIKMFDEAAREP